MLMDDMCTAEKTTLEFTRTAVLFFHHAVGNERSGWFESEWLSNSRQNKVGQTDRVGKKGSTDQRKPGGKTRVGIWFPHKKHEVPPAHTLKENVADTT